MQSTYFLKIIETFILEIIEEKIHLNMRQFAYKKGSSANDAVLILKETMHRATRNKKQAFALFIDIKKAFDNVSYLKLLDIMIKRNLPPDIVHIVYNYLSNQSAYVTWNSSKGRLIELEKGVRQGGCLSAFLFTLYIDHVLNSITQSDFGCKMGALNVGILSYADDIVLTSYSRSGLEKMYNILKVEIQNLQLEINVDKTRCMIFSKKKAFSNPETSIVISRDEI